MLCHDVYFTLRDASPGAIEALVASCERLLKPHPGVVFFACGRLAAGLERPVNDRGFHVGLHIAFKDRADHDAYQDAPGHHEFIAENEANWAKVRVFDTDCVSGGTG